MTILSWRLTSHGMGLGGAVLDMGLLLELRQRNTSESGMQDQLFTFS